MTDMKAKAQELLNSIENEQTKGETMEKELAYVVETPEGWEVAIGAPNSSIGLRTIGEGNCRALAERVARLWNEATATRGKSHD